MIPILYEKNETVFQSNGLGRLADCLSCTVTEERNGIYEADFSYPVSGLNYEKIQLGRIVAVTHDDSGDVEPFDIVSRTRPINGVVSFHAVHISYRLNKDVNYATGVSDLRTALQLAVSGEFTASSPVQMTGYVAAFDGVPKTCRTLLGGGAGSILDTYGGELEFKKFAVILHRSRGQTRSFSIRYGVNMTDYTDEQDTSEAFNGCIPFWKKGEELVVGSSVTSYLPTVTGRDEYAALDLSDKFETRPTTLELEEYALSYMQGKQVNLPTQNITVQFVQTGGDLAQLQKCNLCDTIQVAFPAYGMSGWFKIVKTTYNVLENRYDSLELGALRATLAEALGISSGSSGITSGGGGGGGIQSVTVIPIITSGTKIAEVEVDGATTDLYAPSGGGFSPSAEAVNNFASTNATFTPAANGVLTFCYRATAAGAYVGVTDTNLNRYVAQNTIMNANHYASVAFPVIVGHTYKIISITNSTQVVATVTYFGS